VALEDVTVSSLTFLFAWKTLTMQKIARLSVKITSSACIIKKRYVHHEILLYIHIEHLWSVYKKTNYSRS